MPTEEERREAACMVRSASNQSPRMWQQIRGMLGMPKDCGIPQIREHLASLIEPEPERTCHDVARGDEFFRCSSCGNAMSVEYGDSRLFMNDYLCLELDYCPFCGARVVDE